MVTDLSDNKEDDDNEQDTFETKSEVFALKTEVFALNTEVFAFASRSKAKAKPPRRISACSFTKTLFISERFWIDIEPENYSPIPYPVSKQESTLSLHGHVLREDDGAIQFWRLKNYVRYEFENSQCWFDEMWKSEMQGG